MSGERWAVAVWAVGGEGASWAEREWEGASVAWAGAVRGGVSTRAGLSGREGGEPALTCGASRHCLRGGETRVRSRGACGAGRAGRNWASRGVWGPGLSAGLQACWAGRGEKKRTGRG